MIRGVETVYLLLAVNVVIWLAMTIAAPAPPPESMSNSLEGVPADSLLRWGGNYAPLIRRGQVYRLAAAPLLHLSLPHMAWNSVGLFYAWAILVEGFGSRRLILVYTATGILSGLVSSLWRWNAPVPPDSAVAEARARGFLAGWWIRQRTLTVTVGASGAIAGLVGAGVTWGLLLGGAEGRGLAIALGLWGAAILVHGLATGVDNMAHVGGLVGGALLALLFPIPVLQFAPRLGLGLGLGVGPGPAAGHRDFDMGSRSNRRPGQPYGLFGGSGGSGTSGARDRETLGRTPVVVPGDVLGYLRRGLTPRLIWSV